MLIQGGCSRPKEVTRQVWYVGAHDDSLRVQESLAVVLAWAWAMAGFTGSSQPGLKLKAAVYLACACAEGLLEGGPHTLAQVAGLILRNAL